MIDGLAVQAFESALNAGTLPNIQNLIKTRPTSSMRAISTFPSATSPSVPEFLSGRFSEIDNLPVPAAVHAFDREQHRVIRYVTDPDSWNWPITSLFDATRGLSAITVFEGRWDGPTTILTQFNIAKQAVLDFFGAKGLSDGDRGPVEGFFKAVRSSTPPSISFVVLNEFDMAAHFYGPNSAEAREALIASDRLIGEIIQTLSETAGNNNKSQLEETVIALFGDHGLTPSGRFVDLVNFFKTRELKAVDVSTVPHVMFRERLGKLWTEWPDVILVSGGSNITQVYLRQAKGNWRKNTMTPTINNSTENNGLPTLEILARAISTVEGVDQVIWMNGDKETRVLTQNNVTARIYAKNDGSKRFAYVLEDEAQYDPFAYLDIPEIKNLICRSGNISDACFFTRTQWFDTTMHSRYPGAVALLSKAFHPNRFTGDLMVTLKPGYSFIRNQKGDHGNLLHSAILTPLILNGPGITPCTESHQPKLVDLYPTVSVLLGAEPDDPAFHSLDGRVLDCVK